VASSLAVGVTWRLFARDASMRRVAELDDFQSAEVVARHNATGAFMVDLPASAAPLFDFTAGIVFVRDGRTLLSGPVTGIRREWGDGVDKLVVSGPDDGVWLDRRLVLPVPSGPPYPEAYDVRTGPAETVMRAYVDVNLGPAARPERRVPGLTLAPDGAQGRTVTGRGRFQTAQELLVRLALAGRVGYRIVQEGNGLQFQVFTPADRTRTAIFSEGLGNLAGFTYDAQAAEANYVLAAGGGQGTSRTIRERGDSASIVRYGRIEVFKDQRHTTEPAELDQAVEEELAERADRVGLSIAPVDTEGLRFGVDYDLGDRVTVVVDGTPVRDLLREVTFRLGADGETVTPTVGTPSHPGAVLGVFEQLRRLRSRVSGLERS
jgi:hypothetical protein